MVHQEHQTNAHKKKQKKVTRRTMVKVVDGTTAGIHEILHPQLPMPIEVIIIIIMITTTKKEALYQ